jgi:hypothetical protein
VPADLVDRVVVAQLQGLDGRGIEAAVAQVATRRRGRRVVAQESPAAMVEHGDEGGAATFPVLDEPGVLVVLRLTSRKGHAGSAAELVDGVEELAAPRVGPSAEVAQPPQELAPMDHESEACILVARDPVGSHLPSGPGEARRAGRRDPAVSPPLEHELGESVAEPLEQRRVHRLLEVAREPSAGRLGPGVVHGRPPRPSRPSRRSAMATDSAKCRMGFVRFGAA